MKELFQLPHHFSMNLDNLRKRARESSTLTSDMGSWLKDSCRGKYGLMTTTNTKMYLMAPGSDEPLAKLEDEGPIMLYLFFEELSDALQFKLIWG